jgi:hypothetical protein
MTGNSAPEAGPPTHEWIEVGGRTWAPTKPGSYDRPCVARTWALPPHPGASNRATGLPTLVASLASAGTPLPGNATDLGSGISYSQREDAWPSYSALGVF